MISTYAQLLVVLDNDECMHTKNKTADYDLEQMQSYQTDLKDMQFFVISAYKFVHFVLYTY